MTTDSRQEVDVNERVGNRPVVFVPKTHFPMSKETEQDRVMSEEILLTREEKAVSRNYQGLRGVFRLLKVARVILALALYIYLDQYDMHRIRHRGMAEARLQTARRLTRWAVVGERLRSVPNSLFHLTMLTLRRFIIGKIDNREAIQERQAIWLKDNLIRLGPTFIKMGQALGTRADLLPLPFVKALGELQDSVPPFSNNIAFARLEKELGKKINEVYAEFDLEPIAAASLGQVYRARLLSGEEVAVKIQRPNLEAIIRGDIDILRKIAGFAERFPSLNENADWAGMLREFDETVHEEMDYSAEGRNAERFTANFADWPQVHVPKIFWGATTAKAITMEFIRGDKVTDLAVLRGRGVAPEDINRLLIRTYLKQLLEDGFFHADPHPGNLLVMMDGRLAFFDFGMVGRISPRLQSKMIDAFFHIVSKDAPGIAQDLIELDFLKPGSDPETVRPVVEKMFKFHLDLKLKDVKFKELTYDLADVMYDYPFRLPSNFTYIMRALMTLEGIGIITDPEFNFFETAKPYAKEFMLKRESRDFRQLIIDKLMGREASGSIDFERTWKLVKMAFRSVFSN
jgi:predicted unusual protein kinase regulating ubiquinone biosynthesis (AarF/ABC1/UbiB family)